MTSQLNAEEIAQLKARADEAEFHAKGVRELQAQRDRTTTALGLLAEEADNISSAGLRNIVRCLQTTRSELHQDVYALIINGGKCDGFFVEFGACDGKLISNTFTLEALGWRGILSEPLPVWHPALHANRSCIIDTRCVWSRSGERVELNEIAEDRYATQATLLPGQRATSAAHEVQTVSLGDLLQEHNAPAVIDFMSVDVEGAEFDVLNAFDFSFRFRFLAIETFHGAPASYDALEQLMRANGYRRLLPDAPGHDRFYVPAD